TPHAVMSALPRPLFHYFRQRFAQVTNPAIDHLRERLVFSLTSRIGPRPNLLVEDPEQARMLELTSPFLSEEDLDALVEEAARHVRRRAGRHLPRRRGTPGPVGCRGATGGRRRPGR